MNTYRLRFIFPTLLAFSLASPLAVAKVYTCVENGDVVYTSNPKGDCKTTQLPKLGSYSHTPIPRDAFISSSPASSSASVRARPHQVSSRGSAAMPSGPRPAVNVVPRGSDSTRRGILEQELSNERRALAQAQQALSKSRAMKGSNYSQYQANVRQMEGAVLDRQQNIQALQRELGRM